MNNWKVIPDTNGYYEVSDTGQVRNIRTGKILKPRNKKGYHNYNLSVDGESKQVFAHHLVAQAFIGDRPEGMFVLHWDDDKHNNHVSNLRYGSPKENVSDSKRNGCFRSHKLTQEDRQQIITRRKAGEMLKVIAADFGIDITMVSKLALGHR